MKPSCAGSSVGVSKVKDESQIAKAVEAAFLVDARVLVEQGVDAREIECSVLEGEKGGPTEASLPGEIVPGHEFYDYEDKYIDSGSRSVVPADLPASTREEIRRLAARAFDVLGGEGFARVDFFLERGTQRILVSELNSLPGFTPISMFPKMWEASGLPLGKSPRPPRDGRVPPPVARPLISAPRPARGSGRTSRPRLSCLPAPRPRA